MPGLVTAQPRCVGPQHRPTQREWLHHLAPGTTVRLARRNGQGVVTRTKVTYTFVKHAVNHGAPMHLRGAAWSLVINSVGRETFVMSHSIRPVDQVPEPTTK